MKLIVGLGNPGKKYELTRHNIGFLAIDHFTNKLLEKNTRKKFNADCIEGKIENEKIICLKPTTFMNLSGDAVKAWVTYYKVQLHDIIIILDDIELNFGYFRIREKGSPGTHNGLKDIISKLGTQNIKRLRIGVGPVTPDYDLKNFVLSTFNQPQLTKLDQLLEKSSEALKSLCTQTIDVTMNQFNKKVLPD